ncbi:MAG: hypothetical protein IPJ87_06875 [Flavobacteriales bacterium]|jgi:hypothetical protein|nr:hypothetical protein [Flavobacteriales bacterium]MBK7941583.1 hypothetical protein [Flavobacteriales bacterium]MBK9700128.1 hypothetical protein [Flavobacteriales bacterium]
MSPRTIPVSLLVAALCACGGSGEERPPASDKLIIGDSSATAPAPASLYQMPTPNELFAIVRQMAGEGQKRMMNPTTSADRYATLGGRAFNFGVYCTDLIYASYFDLNVEVVRYYLTVKKLGEQLGLSAAFSEADFVRLERNLSKGDSLEIISNEAYYKAYEKLQEEEMGPTLALVLAGGWVESLHLVMKQVESFDPADPLVKRVGEQKFSLEHLIEMMDAYSADPHVAPIRERMIALRDIYDRMQVQRTTHAGKSSSGRMVLGDDLNVQLSAERYGELQAAVEALRAELVSPEGQVPAQPNA